MIERTRKLDCRNEGNEMQLISCHVVLEPLPNRDAASGLRLERRARRFTTRQITREERVAGGGKGVVAAATGGQRVGFVQKRRGLRSTSHLCNNGADNGQRASSVSLKHALNSREPTNWLKPREPGRNQLSPSSSIRTVNLFPPSWLSVENDGHV